MSEITGFSRDFKNFYSYFSQKTHFSLIFLKLERRSEREVLERIFPGFENWKDFPTLFRANRKEIRKVFPRKYRKDFL